MKKEYCSNNHEPFDFGFAPTTSIKGEQKELGFGLAFFFKHMANEGGCGQTFLKRIFLH
jgi:hypothetical protein